MVFTGESSYSFIRMPNLWIRLYLFQWMQHVFPHSSPAFIWPGTSAQNEKDCKNFSYYCMVLPTWADSSEHRGWPHLQATPPQPGKAPTGLASMSPPAHWGLTPYSGCWGCVYQRVLQHRTTCHTAQGTNLMGEESAWKQPHLRLSLPRTPLSFAHTFYSFLNITL